MARNRYDYEKEMYSVNILAREGVFGRHYSRGEDCCGRDIPSHELGIPHLKWDRINEITDSEIRDAVLDKLLAIVEIEKELSEFLDNYYEKLDKERIKNL